MHQKPHLGGSTVLWEEPDTCVTTFVGDIDGHEMRRVTLESKRLTLSRAYFISLVDLSRMRSVSAEARKASMEGGADPRSRGTAIFGASPQFRIIASLVNRAIELLHKRENHQTRFFDTEAEAREWVAQRRKQIVPERPA